MEQSNLFDAAGINYAFLDKDETKSFTDPMTLQQIHSVKVITLTSAQTKLEPADALVTNHSGLKLTMKTADCAPVLLADPVNRIVGAAHAGWKGAITGVVESTLLAMTNLGAEMDEIIAVIGPCIHVDSYPVGDEIINLISPDMQPFLVDFADKKHFDMPGYVAERLRRSGVTQIDIIPVDTLTDQRYNSFRRNATKDRQYSAIWL